MRDVLSDIFEMVDNSELTDKQFRGAVRQLRFTTHPLFFQRMLQLCVVVERRGCVCKMFACTNWKIERVVGGRRTGNGNLYTYGRFT